MRQLSRSSRLSSATSTPRTLVAIPVFNEVEHLDGVIAKALSFNADILVIDDGSSDGTREKLAAHASAQSGVRVLQHATNKGYGQSLIDAFAYGAREGFDWVITMDCDEQHEPEMIPAFKAMIAEDRWDIISGTRYRAKLSGDNDAPKDRAAINGVLTKVLNNLYPLHLTDSFCGFKAHRVSAMSRIHLTETGYAFPMQLWPQVAAADLRLIELPVRRIYVDPNRTFGGNLDQPTIRLTHYLDVLGLEHQKLFNELLDLPTAISLLSGAAALPSKATFTPRTPPSAEPDRPSLAAMICAACCCG